MERRRRLLVAGSASFGRTGTGGSVKFAWLQAIVVDGHPTLGVSMACCRTFCIDHIALLL